MSPNNNGEFKFIRIGHGTITFPDKTIKQRDVIKFTFTRTPIEDVVTMVNVKFKKDLRTKNYTKVTGYCDAHDFFGNGDNGADCLMYDDTVVKGFDYTSLGLTRESNILEFEAEYIRDYNSAEKLRDYLLTQNCQQHTIIKCTLPLKYIDLEVGDVVDFDSLNNNTKAYGEDYTQENTRNNQSILPNFVITSASKSKKGLNIECFQLHDTNPTFLSGQGSLSRRSQLGINGALVEETGVEDVFGYSSSFNLIPNGHFTWDDISFFEKIVAGDVNYMTSKQKRNADLNSDNSIDQYDLNVILALFQDIITSDDEDDTIEDTDQDTSGDDDGLDDNVSLGDVNGDGVVNVVDIVSVVSYILGDGDYNDFIAADINEDGIINVVDIVAMVATILET